MATEPSTTVPGCVGGSGVHVGSGVDVAGGSGVDVGGGSGVDVGGGSGVQVAVGQRVDVASGSRPGTAVSAGGTTGDGTHAARTRAPSATSISWLHRATGFEDVPMACLQSNRLLPFASHVSVEEHHGPLHSETKNAPDVAVTTRIDVQRPGSVADDFELLSEGITPTYGHDIVSVTVLERERSRKSARQAFQYGDQEGRIIPFRLIGDNMPFMGVPEKGVDGYSGGWLGDAEKGEQRDGEAALQGTGYGVFLRGLRLSGGCAYRPLSATVG